MNKQEFISFLVDKNIERKGLTSWVQTFDNSYDYWTLYKPAVDWLADDMDLIKDDIVKITYDKQLYDNTVRVLEMTYEEFIENYNETLK